MLREKSHKRGQVKKKPRKTAAVRKVRGMAELAPLRGVITVKHRKQERSVVTTHEQTTIRRHADQNVLQGGVSIPLDVDLSEF